MATKIEFSEARVRASSYDLEDLNKRLENLTQLVKELAENLKTSPKNIYAFLKLRNERFNLLTKLNQTEPVSP